MRLISIIGTRPQIVKASAFSRIAEEKTGIEEILVHTGQHYDRELSDLFFEELEIKRPKYNLAVGSASHAVQTAEMMVKLEEIIDNEKPQAMMVYGDTNSTLAAALVAAKSHIPLAHVESGLRSFNKFMPEEINRIVTDQLSDILFCPTELAVSNLINEGVNEKKIHLVGDIMYDACINYTEIARTKSTIMEDLDLEKNRFVLATIHRAENTDDVKVLKAIVDALEAIAEGIRVILPLHPRTKSIIGNWKESRIEFITPIGYLDMLEMERNAKVIITDSGGVQKEAFFHGVPCITIRSETEWVELIDYGWNQLIDPTKTCSLKERLLIAESNSSPGKEVSLYGKGNTSELIWDKLIQWTDNFD